MSGPLHLGLVMQGGAGWMGGSEYIKNLAQAVVAAAGADGSSIEVSLLTGHPLPEAMRAELGIHSVIDLPPRRRGLLSRWSRAGNRAFGAAVQRAKIDFLYPLTYDNEHNVGASFPLRKNLAGTRWAGWIPDFQHRHLPELFDEREIGRREAGIAALTREAELIFFSSEASAADYRRFFPKAKARAEVLRFCTAPVLAWLAGDPVAEQVGYHLPNRFFLISNQLWKHKNHLLLFEALHLLRSRGIRPLVLCTGQLDDYRDRAFAGAGLEEASRLRVRDGVQTV